jgi:hypothetical protein
MSQIGFNRAQLTALFESRETCGSSGHLHPSCPSNAMNIVFRTIRQIVIHHMADVRHIDPAGRDIRCDKNSDLPSFKSVQSTEALG